MSKTIEERLSFLEEKIIEKTQESKKPRKATPYNEFMKEYIANKKSKGTTKSHKELFTEGAKQWSTKKK